MNLRTFASLAATTCVLTSGAQAAFHLMQIQEIIGGVNGDNTAQAIQLRLRSAGQSGVSSASLWAEDAAGNNRVLLLNIAGNVTSGATGATVLLTTASFNNAMIAGGNTGFTGDFTLAAPIPAADLAAGKLTFEQDGGTVSTPGTVYWSVAWGGASYTGTNTGVATPAGNDDDGFFGDNLTHAGPFGSALPTSSRQGLMFTGTAGAGSSNNAADYTLTANPASVTKNSGTTLTVTPEPGSASVLLAGGLGLSGLAFVRRRRRA